MPRLNNDRGAVAVIVAILMVPLLGFAAISIDIAATHAEKQQLQNGADAAALAIAQDCSREACDETKIKAQAFATANSNTGNAEADLPIVPTANSGRVTVYNSATREHWFAPILGVDSTDIRTSATAGWGTPSAGTARLPLVFSWCEFMAQTNNGVVSGTTERTIFLSKKSGTGCHGSSGLAVPGGFGWVKQDPGEKCTATSEIDGLLYSDPGNNQKCTNEQFAALVGKTILLPIFGRDDGRNPGRNQQQSGISILNNDPCNKPGKGNERKCREQGGGGGDGGGGGGEDDGGEGGGGDDDGGSGGSGNNAWYRVHAYAAFTVTGYQFSPHAKFNANNCSNSAYCLKGYFTKMHDRHPDFEYGADAPNLGASAVYLLPD